MSFPFTLAFSPHNKQIQIYEINVSSQSYFLGNYRTVTFIIFFLQEFTLISTRKLQATGKEKC